MTRRRRSAVRKVAAKNVIRVQFRDAIAAAGLVPPDDVVADGKFHRFASNGKRGDDAGTYVLHMDGVPAGWFRDFRTGIEQKWRAECGRLLTP